MLQVGDQDKADDDEQKPRSDLAEADHVPTRELVGIFPGAQIRRDVFRDPDEERNQAERDGERDAAYFVDHDKLNPRAPIDDEDKRDQDPADVRQIVVGKKVDIDHDAKDCRRAVAERPDEFEFHDAPTLADVAADGRVHEPAVERYGAKFKIAEFRIRP